MLLGNRELTSEEFNAFSKALLKAFDLDTFDTMLLKAFGWTHTHITNTGGFEDIVPRIIRRMEQDNLTYELLTAALAERLQNRHLLTFAQTFGITPSPSQDTPPAQQPSPSSQPVVDPLERKIRELDSDLDPAQWRTRLEHLEKQICKISIKVGRKEICGTGFLLNADIIMTNYHVMKDVIDGPISPQNVTAYFDYKLDADGKKASMGIPYKLGKAWLIDHSPNSDADFQITEQFPDIEEKYLDYALLRLATKVGNERLQDNSERGWIHLPETECELKQGSSLFILHHPDGDPLKLAMNTQSVVGINGNKTRIRYSTSTENGSSGAPCFNANWELVAIHQSGDPDFSHSAQYNQGIPIATILRRLEKFGKKRLLGSKKNSKDIKQDGSSSVLPHLQFGLPEREMSDDAQVLLAMFLRKMEPMKFFPSQSEKREPQLPLVLTTDQLERITDKLSKEQLHLLLTNYVHVEYVIAERAQKPFIAHADSQPTHFKAAIKALDLIEECLRKVCTLLNYGSSVLSGITLETISQFTVEADTLIEKISALRQYLAEVKDRFPYTAKIHSHVREKFAEVLNNLDKFQRKFLENDS